MNAILLASLLLLGLLCAVARAAGPEPGALDLRGAVVVTAPGLAGPELKAVTMLAEEVEDRTGIRWPVASAWPPPGRAVVAVGSAAALPAFAGAFAGELGKEADAPGAEGYRIRTRRHGEAPAVVIVGTDARGVLFGVGRLLRRLRMDRGRVDLAAGPDLATAPRYSLRGHQLGYRPKTNSYDGWDLRQWEQYYRDLAIFGCNAVELIPPRSDDDADSPHFPLAPLETMVGMSRLADEYGLDVWIWYPAMDPDYADPKTVEFALREWGEVFRRLPRIDAVFVPGGDPGHTAPRPLMGLLERQARQLRESHPEAKLWVSPQGFTAAWMDEFLGLLRAEQPAWLAGLVHGPQVRMSLPELRAAIPARYPIRQYPDITHSLQCQYPVPDWDVAFALTAGREGINPRPLDEARLFRATQPATLGFLAYSEGCNDDVNKAVWSALGWDPDADVVGVLRDYGRVFIGDRDADAFAQGLLALERNWQGPLLTNAGVETTLQQFQALERAASPRLRRNWRFQQALYRAYYDAYTRRRLLAETQLEAAALEALRGARQQGTARALDEAAALLARAATRPVAPDLRARVFALAEALFQSVRMQLSVERYQAIAVGRGANLDTLEVPLNNRRWLEAQFAALRALPEESARLAGIDAILGWTDPGPGGFYDDLGDPCRRPHLVPGPHWWEDPGTYASWRTGFAVQPGRRLAWCRHAETLYDQPLTLRYPGLDATARYRVRVVYAGDSPRIKIRLAANEGLEIHPFLEKPAPVRPLEFDLPPAATASGTLTLHWTREPGGGGNGRGCQVSEVWLMKR
jgi:hypothetical protein